MATLVAVCANHPEREAIGICVSCRTRICSECSTKVDGINYCVSCLAGLAVDHTRTQSRRLAWLAVPNAASAAVYFAALAGLVWVFLEVMLGA